MNNNNKKINKQSIKSITVFSVVESNHCFLRMQKRCGEKNHCRMTNCEFISHVFRLSQPIATTEIITSIFVSREKNLWFSFSISMFPFSMKTRSEFSSLGFDLPSAYSTKINTRTLLVVSLLRS